MPRVNWIEAQKGIGNLFGSYWEEQKKKKEQQDVLNFLREKLKLEQEYSPMDAGKVLNQIELANVLRRITGGGQQSQGQGILPYYDQQKRAISNIPQIGRQPSSSINIQPFIQIPTGEYDKYTGQPAMKTVENPQYKEELEKQKGYGDVEAGVISKAEKLVPFIDELITLIKKPGNLFRIPGAQGRISAFGESGPQGGLFAPFERFGLGLKRKFTIGGTRQAGLLLQKIKVLAFGEGGKALTEPEKAIIMPLLNPSLKDESQWITDLNYVKSLLERKAQLMIKGTPKNIKIDNQNDFSSLWRE